MHDKHFTVAEAMQALHQYHSVLQKMSKLAQTMMSSGNEFPGAGGESVAVIASELPPEYQQILEIISMLDSAGIQVKSVEEGLIDFPHIRRNGEEVYLCFKLGEDTIQFWHPIEAGFAGRQPLRDL